MEWKKEYDVGIRDIDEQHRAIARCISSIEHAATRQEGWSTVRLSLVDLADLAQTHFTIEESLMRVHDYPHLEEHARDHKQFLADLKTLQERALATNVPQDGIHSLHEWWDKHIQEHDKLYALDFLKRTALGKS